MTTHSPDTASFSQLLESMAAADFFTGLLPFVTAYILFFLALQRVPLFAENDKQDKFSALISIVFAFFVARFVTENPVYQEFFVDYLGFIAITIIGLIGMMIVLAMVGIKTGTEDTSTTLWGIILALIVLAGFFVTGGASILIPQDLAGDASVLIDIFNFVIESGLIWVIVIGAVIGWTLKPEDTSSSSENGLGDAIGDMFESVNNSSGGG